MKYTDLKSVANDKIKEYMAQGATREQAEDRFLKAGVAMLNSKVIGILDLQLMHQILGRGFDKELAPFMNQAKQTLRQKYCLDEGIEFYQSEGFSQDMAVKGVIQSLYDSMIKGDIEGPEILNGLLWTLGYRLKEKFFVEYYQGKKPKLAYEEDK